MIYLQKNNSRDTRKYTGPLKIFLVFLVILGILSFALPRFAGVIGHTVAYPFIKASALFHRSSLWNYFVSKDSLIRDNEVLRVALIEAQIASTTTEFIRRENIDLKAFLGRSVAKDTLLAAVLQTPPVSPYDSLIVDVGSSDGIVQGARVLGPDEVILGEVEEVFPYTAKVRLYSTPGETHPIVIGPEKVHATATGRGRGNFEVTLPRDAKVVVGDSVTLSEISPRIFGIVEYSTTDSARAFVNVFFKVPVDVTSLTYVEIER